MALVLTKAQQDDAFLANGLNERNVPILSDQQAHESALPQREVLVVNVMPPSSQEASQLDFMTVIGSNNVVATRVTNLNLEVTRTRDSAIIHMPKDEESLTIIQKLMTGGFDGAIFTGASLDDLDYNNIEGLNQYGTLMDLAREQTYGTQFVCWSSMYGLQRYQQIPKYLTDNKLIGIYGLQSDTPDHPLVKDWDFAQKIGYPGARVAYIQDADIENNPRLTPIARAAGMPSNSDITVVYEPATNTIYEAGHGEYGPHALRHEQERDIQTGGQGNGKIGVGDFVGKYRPEDETIAPWTPYVAARYASWQLEALQPEWDKAINGAQNHAPEIESEQQPALLILHPNQIATFG